MLINCEYTNTLQFDTGIHYVGKPWKYTKVLAPIMSKDKPIEWVAQGTKENGYVYDEYLIGGGDNMVTFRARANTRKQDLKNQFPTKQDHEAIDKFYGLEKSADTLVTMALMGKLLGEDKLLYTRYIHTLYKVHSYIVQGTFIYLYMCSKHKHLFQMGSDDQPYFLDEMGCPSDDIDSG